MLEEKASSISKVKQLLIEGGANAIKILEIQEVVAKPSMHPMEALLFPIKTAWLNLDPDPYIHRNKTDIISEAFDLIYHENEKVEADGILLEVVRLMLKENPNLLKEKETDELKDSLSSDGIFLNDILNTRQAVSLLTETRSILRESGHIEAEEKISKCLRRLSTDPEGAVTAAVSATEAVLVDVLRKLEIGLPSKRQLPGYLGELRRKTNIDRLAEIKGHSEKIISPLSTLAANIYQASHEAGDRHANLVVTTPFVRELLVVSCTVLIIGVSRSLERGELKKV